LKNKPRIEMSLVLGGVSSSLCLEPVKSPSFGP
jgi:hypothetical protein